MTVPLWADPRRKGGKLQALALPAPAASRIDAYLAGRDDVTALPAVPGGPAAAARRRVLFATGTGARMYRAEVRALLRCLGRAAGLPEELTGSPSPHAMRHAFATLNLDAGASLRDLQDAMGHASPRTTRRYDRSRGNGAEGAGERKVTVRSAAGAGPGKFRLRQAWGSTLGELRRLSAEMLAAAGQLKPVTIEALLRGWPGTGSGA